MNPCFRRIIQITLLSTCLAIVGIGPLMAQYEKRYIGEVGITAGAAHYFGDLNTRTALNSPKPSVGIYYKYLFNNYLGVKGTFRFLQLGYSDVYNTNDFEHKRNLSFNSNVFEFDVQGDFNFFRFEPGSLDYEFTPYLTAGLGIFGFDPYTYYEGTKYYLQPLRTEGQGSPLYPDRKLYNRLSHAYLIGFGFKYNYSSKINLGLEFLYRFTGTDYLDDVSTTYVGENFFPLNADGSQSIASILQDRSGAVTSPKIGEAGRQRGNSRDKDHFASIEFTIGFLFTSYKCKF
ncbi:hypothetical protein COR50_03360 [Chitinophaga caeni]|uniref:DUF6089 domain-containing protein n=2 Tax=Chitinophaga caeni TaxID=2029983 RepID=A0A291R0T6_9BACT|nr:DUF6089 family protein [Chitinophaga caeni]ATL49713.1 hypothetical protein COR50_03360 [Chitinophaga caeni]